MQAFFYGLAALACPLGMGLMMWMMMRGMRQGTHGSGESGPAGGDRASEVAELRADIERLKADRAARGPVGL